MSGLAVEVWKPDEKTRERREVLAVHERCKRDAVRCRNRIWSWLTQHGIKKPKGLKLSRETGLNWILESRDWSERQEFLIRTMHANLAYATSKRKDLRSILVQCAHSILRMGSDSNPLAVWGRAMIYRKCRNVAAIAVARKLTVYVWYLLRGFFTPLDNLSASFRTKPQKLAVEIGTPLGREMGYKTISEEFLLISSGEMITFPRRLNWLEVVIEN